MITFLVKSDCYSKVPVFMQLPQLVTQLTQAMVSIHRLEDFLREEEQSIRSTLVAPESGDAFR